MHLRRALLLFAIVLMVAALAATLAPGDKAPGDTATPPQPPAAPRSPGESIVRLTIDGRSGTPTRKGVQLGAHVALSVPVDSAGDVSVTRLGLVETAEPGTPAVFDFIADQPGSIGVAFEPPKGNTEPLGSLVVDKRR